MKNFFFSIFTIIIIIIVLFSSLNFLLSGVPLFNVFNINVKQAVYVSKNEDYKKNYEISFDEETKYYSYKCGDSENGFYNMAYIPDDFGFRENKKELFFNTDIIIIGDSFGVSNCVNYPFDLTTKLKQKLKNDKILNISVSGTGPYYQKELLKCVVNQNKTSFNTLIWLFYEGNDHEDLNNFFGKRVECPDSNGGNTNNSNIEVKYKIKENTTILKIKLFLSNFTRGFGTALKYFKDYPKLISNDKDYISVVDDMRNYLDSKNINNRIIFYIPKYTRLAHNNDSSHPQIRQLDNLKNFVQSTALKYNFKFIDGTKIFHNLKDPLGVFHYRLPTHFNIKGYDILAFELKKSLDLFE